MDSKKTQFDADVIFNRANVALARSQALIQSWLGPQDASDLPTKSEEALQKEDDELFKPIPETLGVGATTRIDDSTFAFKRRENPTNVKLLEQILGKKGARGHLAAKARPNAQGEIQSRVQQSHAPSQKVKDDSDSEGDGRAAMITSQRPSRQRMRNTVAAKSRVDVHGNVSSDDTPEQNITSRSSHTHGVDMAVKQIHSDNPAKIASVSDTIEDVHPKQRTSKKKRKRATSPR